MQGLTIRSRDGPRPGEKNFVSLAHGAQIGWGFRQLERRRLWRAHGGASREHGRHCQREQNLSAKQSHAEASAYQNCEVRQTLRESG